MPSNVTSNDLTSVESCLRQIQLLLEESKYNETTKLCHKYLKKWPEENILYNVKIYCEMQSSQWRSCLQTIGWLHGYHTHPIHCDKRRKKRKTETDDSVELREKISKAAKLHRRDDTCLWFHFEQSYCYYKLGKYDLGLQALSLCLQGLPPRDLIKQPMKTLEDVEIKSSDLKVSLLYAQLCLKLGYYDKARNIYDSIKVKDNIENLIHINRLSVELALVSDSKDENILQPINRDIDTYFNKKHDEPYELYFNFACASVLSNNQEYAQYYLDIAAELLENELRDEVGEEDYSDQIEYSNILAFRSYLHGERGNVELARKINNDLLDCFYNSDADQSTILVALNNQLALNSFNKEDVSNIVQKIEQLMKREQVLRKFTNTDIKLIHQTCIVSLLSTGNIKECQRYLDNFKRHLRNEDFIYLKSALLFIEGKLMKSVSLLRQCADVRTVITLVKLLMHQGRNKEALSVLEENLVLFQDKDEGYIKLYYTLLVKLHIQLNTHSEVHNTLTKLLDTNIKVSGIDDVIRLGCGYLEARGMYSECLFVYDVLYKRDPSDALSLCGISYNTSFLKDEMSVPLTRDFTDPLVRDIRFIDPEELESASKVTFQLEQQNDIVKIKKRRRKKPNKKPKNPILGPPDPERWLHKYERVAYKKIAKKRRDANKGATQGSTSTVNTNKPTTGTISANAAAIKRGKRKKR